MGKTKIIFEVIFQNYHPMALYEAVFKKGFGLINPEMIPTEIVQGIEGNINGGCRRVFMKDRMVMEK